MCWTHEGLVVVVEFTLASDLGSVRGEWPELQQLVHAGQTKFPENIGTIKDISNLDLELVCGQFRYILTGQNNHDLSLDLKEGE